jgi:hypothetical protein
MKTIVEAIPKKECISNTDLSQTMDNAQWGDNILNKSLQTQGFLKESFAYNYRVQNCFVWSMGTCIHNLNNMEWRLK